MTLHRTRLAAALLALICGAGASAFAQQRNHTQPRPSGPMAQPARMPSVSAPHVTQPIKTTPSPALLRPAGPAGGKPELIAPRNGASANLVESSSASARATGAIPAANVVSASPGASLGPSGMIGAPPPGSLVHQPLPRQPLSDVVAPGSVRITIRAISAAGQGQNLEIDGRLAPIGKDLRSFADQFSYRNYRLLDVQTFDLDFRSIAQMELPGQRAIAVEPRQTGDDGRVKVHLELLGQHPEHAPRMRADYSISRGSTIFVGGYKIAPEGGTLLLAITQDE